jgi:sugar/nucleoside kinase (ribokinase family)
VVPPDWKATIVHLGPVARECSPALVDAFEDSFIGVTPQGWMRRWDEAGHVHAGEWERAERVLARADCVVLSEEDIRGDVNTVAHYAARTRLLVVTAGARGCTVYECGRGHHHPALSVHEVDPTGAGDIFAAAFFVWQQRGGDASGAARFANCVAAHSVTRVGPASTPCHEEIARCERAARV